MSTSAGAMTSTRCGEFDDEAYHAISAVMKIRELIRGYVHDQLQLATAQGQPVHTPANDIRVCGLRVCTC